MPFRQETISLASRQPIQILDISDRVRDFVRSSGVKNGLLVIASQHTTMGIVINEKCEHLEKDMIRFLEKLVPYKGEYEHNRHALDGRPNAHSHLLSLVIPNAATIVVVDEEPQLGTWQSIFAVELDGPRPSRKIHLTALSS